MSVKTKKLPKGARKAAAQAAGPPVASSPALPPEVTPSVFYPRQGALIAKARQNAELTQAQLAAYIGHKRASVSHIEAGIQKPLPHILLLIADVLKVKIQELFPPSLAETRDVQATLDSLPADVREKLTKHMPAFPRAES